MPKMLKNSVTYPVTENCTQNQLLPEIIYISEVIIRKSQKKKKELVSILTEEQKMSPSFVNASVYMSLFVDTYIFKYIHILQNIAW